jgi:anti-sigma B factor antagonist
MKISDFNDFNEVYVVGPLNIYTAMENQKTFISYSKDNKNIILDLSNVNEFDTAGLQIILALKKQLNSIGKNLYLRSCSEIVKSVLKILFLNKELEMVE